MFGGASQPKRVRNDPALGASRPGESQAHNQGVDTERGTSSEAAPDAHVALRTG